MTCICVRTPLISACVVVFVACRTLLILRQQHMAEIKEMVGRLQQAARVLDPTEEGTVAVSRLPGLLRSMDPRIPLYTINECVDPSASHVVDSLLLTWPSLSGTWLVDFACLPKMSRRNCITTTASLATRMLAPMH